jgi:hypothetical protein
MTILTNFILYQTDNDKVEVKVYLQGETIWLTQQLLADLFDTSKQNISQHIKRIFSEGELEESSVVNKFFTTATDGKKYQTNYYNLDAIIAVGYRINSRRATQFRIWATRLLKEFIIKGFILDDERLKQAQTTFGKDYFRELLDRVRSIRTSERRIYQQVTDIFAECTVDYDKSSDVTRSFYAFVQNKFHFAITGYTAAEIIYQQADYASPNMGLQTWKNAPDGRILSADVTVAKNYLQENEIKRLERTITGFFDYIENVIENRTLITMQSMSQSVDKFISFNEYRVLDNKGSVSKKVADDKAKAEYQIFNKKQKIVSDFDKLVTENLKLVVRKKKGV